MLKQELRYELLTETNPQQAATIAMGIFDKVDTLYPHLQVAAVSLLFLAVIKKFGIHAGNALAVAQNMYDRASHVPEIKAINHYVQTNL